MKAKFFFCAALCACICSVNPALAADEKASESQSGWKQLFDGKTLNGWKGFKKDGPPAQGWVAEEGVLKHIKKGGGGDLVSTEEFGDFDLRWEWKIAPGANSGLKYFITEKRGSAIGHEYQLIDDKVHPDALSAAKRQTAGVYDVLAPSNTTLHPAGEWNESRVLVQGNHVEHWLNGKKVLSYELGSSELKSAIAQSKFKSVDGFGEHIQGRILLQDHGDETYFRNIRIKALKK